MDALRQAYAETRNDVSREWTSQAESLWAEEYKDEMGMLRSWQRKKRMSWEDDFVKSRSRFSSLKKVSQVREKVEEEYFKAELELAEYSGKPSSRFSLSRKVSQLRRKQSRLEGEEQYLKAKKKGEDVDFEMNDLFWRLSVRRFAVRAQVVDIV